MSESRLDLDDRQAALHGFRQMAELCALYRDALVEAGAPELVVPVVSQWATWMLAQAGATSAAPANAEAVEVMRGMLDAMRKLTGQDEEDE